MLVVPLRIILLSPRVKSMTDTLCYQAALSGAVGFAKISRQTWKVCWVRNAGEISIANAAGCPRPCRNERWARFRQRSVQDRAQD
jgi:hypothetical protein